MNAQLTPEMILLGYSSGLFPMADPDENNAIYWYRPDPRAILPLDGFRMSRSLRKTVRRGRFRVTLDEAFEAVIRACADRESTWISEEIIHAYVALHRAGYGHSFECWSEEGLAGGLYGVSLGRAFFGESMFHRETDASKVALVHLVEHLRDRDFLLLDVQYATPHLAQFGVIEISDRAYRRRLTEALGA